MSTRIQGPYDDIHSIYKRRIQTMVPAEAYERWFGPLGAFPLRGVQDKILARFFHLVDAFILEHNLCPVENLDNEDILNEILNEIEIHYDPSIRGSNV